MSKESSFTVHDLPKPERPRERLQKFGPEALSAQELLALVIGRGIPKKSVMNIAQELLAKFGNIKAISQATIEELSQIKGIGLAKAAQIKACFELGKREDLEPEVKDFDGVALFGTRDARRMDRFVQFALAATLQALKHSNLTITESNRDKIGSILGCGIGGMGTLTEQTNIFLNRGPDRVSPLLVPMMLPDAASIIDSMSSFISWRSAISSRASMALTSL